jgi:signal transduction histidine kinase
MKSGKPKLGIIEQLQISSGEKIWVQTDKVPYRDEQDNITGVIAFVVDITERKQAEAQREKLIGELEDKNAELERFTYTVSHDLKTPLITVKGFVGLLEQDIAAESAERIKSDMTRITEATDKMQRLLDELLQLSRIGRVVNPPVEVSLDELAREAVELIAGEITEFGVEVEISPDLPVVHGDRPRLLEVIQNLVDNAVKFMGGQPDPRIEIGVRQEGRETVFYVRDNGIGIDPRYHEKVFDLFDQLDQKIKGTGIGLALVKRIVETHEGRIWIESEGPGQGSTFCFTISEKGDSVNEVQ